MTKSIVATYEDRQGVEKALEYLTKEGYDEKDVSILITDSSRGKHFQIENNSKVPEGISKGAIAGGALGALVAGLTSVGAVASGGTILAAGPLVSSLAGLGGGGAVGGLLGGLTGLGYTENEARLSSEDVEKGHILLGVNVDESRTSDMKKALKEMGSQNVAVQH